MLCWTLLVVGYAASTASPRLCCRDDLDWKDNNKPDLSNRFLPRTPKVPKVPRKVYNKINFDFWLNYENWNCEFLEFLSFSREMTNEKLWKKRRENSNWYFILKKHFFLTVSFKKKVQILHNFYLRGFQIVFRFLGWIFFFRKCLGIGYWEATTMIMMTTTLMTTPMMIFILAFSQKCLRLILTAARWNCSVPACNK